MAMNFFKMTTPSTPATWPVMMFAWLQFAVTQGCTVEASGDGLALVSTSGLILTSGLTGAGGLGNNRAWFVLNVGSNERWCFQRGTDNDVWSLLVSRSTAFSGGSPTANTRPTAVGEFFVGGSGTPAAPVGTSFFNSSNAFDKNIIMGMDNTAPRRFYTLSYAVSGSSGQGFFFRDVVAPTEPTDADVVVRGFVRSPAIAAYAAVANAPTGTSFFAGFYPTAGIPTTVVFMGMASLGLLWATVSFPAGVSALAISGNDPESMVQYFRPSAAGNGCIKGISTLIAIQGVGRANGDTLSVNTPRDRVCFSSLVFPWDGTVPVV